MVRMLPRYPARRRSRRAPAVTLSLLSSAVALALALSGCAGGAGGRLAREPGAAGQGIVAGTGSHSNQGDITAHGTPISSLRPVDTQYSAEYFGQRLAWKPCHHSLECGTVRVPIDWHHAGAASITLALVMHAASGSTYGDLLVNPGGPGGSGVEFVEDGIEGVVTKTVAAHYNVIGFDPRGVGGSAPVTCFSNAATDEYFYSIDPGAIGSAAWIAAEEKKSRDLAAACEKHTGPVLGHIDSISVAEDMDLIRSALAQPKLNFLGYSYGTYLGTLYAGLFPDRVGRFVLDGADDPWGSDFDSSGSSNNGNGESENDFGVDPDSDSSVAQTVGFEDSLSSYLKSCLNADADALGTHTCPFTTSLADAKARVEGLFASVAAHPLVARDGRSLGAATLATAIDDSLYDASDWPDLTRMFAQLETGNPTGAFAFADDYNDRNSDGTYYDNDDFANLAIGCLEDGHDVDLRFDKREATELQKVAPMLGIYSAYGDLACSGWKYGPTPFPNPIHARGSGPILVLGTTGDPATPYSGAQDLSMQLDNGHLVTFHGEGHTAYDLGDSCIDDTVDAYLLDGTVPLHDPECY